MSRRAMRMPVLVLLLFAIAAIASVKSQGTSSPPSPDARVAGTLTMTSAGVHDIVGLAARHAPAEADASADRG